MSEQHGDLAGEQLCHREQGIIDTRGDHRQVQIRELLGERLRRGQVRLGQAQNRRQAAGVGGDQRPVDQAGAWRRVRQRHHDQQLVRVGDDNSFGGVGVIGGASQHRTSRTPAHDAGQGVVASGQIADDVDIVADDDRRAAQLASSHGGDPAIGAAAQHTPPAAAVDADHHGGLRVGVLRTRLGPGPRPFTGPDFDV